MLVCKNIRAAGLSEANVMQDSAVRNK